MPQNMRDFIKRLPKDEQRTIRQRASELIAEEMTLRELRKARRLTQSKVAKALNLTQDNVCRLEQRTDWLISTLRKTVVAMGGDISVIATFPDQPSVRLAGLFTESEISTKRKPVSAKVEGKRAFGRKVPARKRLA